VGGNLLLLVRDMTADRRVRKPVATKVKETLEARPSIG
jgi:hypothetical protein